MENKYYGVWPTMIGAFNEKNEIDYKANKELANYLIEKGANGLFAVCQSTEMFFLSREEKYELTKCILEAVDSRVPVITSGHTAETLEEQIEDMRPLVELGIDAMILVSNRLDPHNKGSEELIKNTQAIFDAFPEVKFGVYECPYPYLRLLTDEEIVFLAKSGRCIFVKDVSCNLEIQKRRVELVKGTNTRLFNANTETLLESLKYGYHGYNGVMGNFHIDLYRWLFDHYSTQLEKAERLQEELTLASEIEKYGYPINAKYHAKRDGVAMELNSRRMDLSLFSDEMKDRVRSLEVKEVELRTWLKG